MILLAAALLALAPPPGEYGVVCFDPATGAMKGSRVVLGGGPSVIFQHCDGGCSAHRTTAVSLTGDDLAFEITSRAKETETARFTGRFRGKALSLKSETPGFPFKPARLRLNQACPRDTVKADA